MIQRKLRNRFIEDRNLARDILKEMCSLLGPKYFSFLLSVLEGTLERGYQVHILVCYFYLYILSSSICRLSVCLSPLTPPFKS